MAFVLTLLIPTIVLADDDIDISTNDAAPVDTSTVNKDAVSLQESVHHQALEQATQSGKSLAPTAPDPHDSDYWKSSQNYEAPTISSPSSNAIEDGASQDAVSTLQGLVANWQKPATVSQTPTTDSSNTQSIAEQSVSSVTHTKDSTASEVAASALAGDVWYSTLTLGADSYVNGPVTARIDSGPYKGGKALGRFQVADDGTHLVLTFNQLSTDSETIPIDAVAISPDAKLAALTGDIDHHIFARYVTPLAIDFLAAAPSMLTETGQNVVMNDNTTVVTSQTLSNGQKALYMTGYAADKFSSQLEPQGVRTLPEVKIAPGTGFGLLIMSPIAE